MITFPVEDTFPLSDGNFHNKKSIISEHYGFTDALIEDEEYCLFCDQKLKTEKYKVEMGVCCHACFICPTKLPLDHEIVIDGVTYKNEKLTQQQLYPKYRLDDCDKIIVNAKPNAAHVAFENFINNEEPNA
jgi:hypothetical protein